MDVYDIYNDCILREGTNGISYCTKMLNNIIPSRNHNDIYQVLNDKYDSYDVTSSFEEMDFENFSIEDNNSFFTNDDIKLSLEKICTYLKEKDYINDSKISFSKEYNSLMLVLKANDNDKREELDIMLDTLPTTFNNEVVTYLL